MWKEKDQCPLVFKKEDGFFKREGEKVERGGWLLKIFRVCLSEPKERGLCILFWRGRVSRIGKTKEERKLFVSFSFLIIFITIW